MKHVRNIISAFAAGICIAIGGTVYLSLDNKIAGALLFTVGLYVIVTQGLNLYTGKVGYLAVKKNKEAAEYVLFLLEVWIGNFFGTCLTAYALSETRVNYAIYSKAAQICMTKFNDSMLSLFLLGILCGILMYCAVDGYKKCQNPLILFVCVSAFILSGFEHCVADMYYFAVCSMLTPESLLILLVITAGNTIGGVLIPVLKTE